MIITRKYAQQTYQELLKKNAELEVEKLKTKHEMNCATIEERHDDWNDLMTKFVNLKGEQIVTEIQLRRFRKALKKDKFPLEAKWA